MNAINYGVNHIELNIVEGVFFKKIQARREPAAAYSAAAWPGAVPRIAGNSSAGMAYLYCEEDSDLFSIEDPVFRYFLNHLELGAFVESLGVAKNRVTGILDIHRRAVARYAPKEPEDSHRSRHREVFISYSHRDAKWHELLQKSRPQFDRIMADAALHKFDCILVWKLDRWGRSVSHCLDSLENLRRAGVRWLEASQPSARNQ